MTFELRQALEPWNVLAEETNSGRTGRSVDSSLERLQVKLTGLTLDPGNGSGRYVVACNGRRVPLHTTDVEGESIAGIRYRARRLSAALHPTVPVHTPLVFDLIDTLKGRSVARCTYFAGRPDGSLYEGRPADASEAKARRRERFQVSPPPADGMQAPPQEMNPVFPMTLDLRWPAPKKWVRKNDMTGDLYQSALPYGATYEESSADGGGDAAGTLDAVDGKPADAWARGVGPAVVAGRAADSGKTGLRITSTATRKGRTGPGARTWCHY